VRFVGPGVEFCTGQELAEKNSPRAPNLPMTAAVFIDGEGERHTGAGAVFAMLGARRERRWVSQLYRALPPFRGVTEAGYRLVAGRRPLFSFLDRWLVGTDPRVGSVGHTCGWFLRGLGAVFAIAFLSFLPQAAGLVGNEGIIPLQRQVASVREALGSSGLWQFPTVFWLNATDGMLHAVCLVGAVAGGLLAAGVLPGVMLLMCWLLYLSLCTVGAMFLSFQWDALLLETALLGMLLAPWGAKLPHGDDWRPPLLPRLLLGFLLFRLMFSSGMVKLLSGDPVWLNLTALKYHYWTQPLPNPMSWFVHQLPQWFHAVCCALMFGIELIVPFFLFLPRRLRIAAAFVFMCFQAVLAMTGNFAFFNVLSALLCVPLLDDAVIRRVPGVRMKEMGSLEKSALCPAWASLPVCASLFVAGCGILDGTLRLGVPGGEFARAVAGWIAPLRSVNSYGLFADMTTRRPEIVLEGSHDAITWREYKFRWKPGDVMRMPGQVAPHQPRLDWQFWFAALGPPERNVWVFQTMKHLANGTAAVTGLMGTDPFRDAPPKHVRALLYQYRFTTLQERASTGASWARELVGQYGPVIDR
jgi:hypothetical protein